MFIGQLALLAAAMFAGAALHVSFSEQPARLLLDDRAALISWQESYARAKVMQAGLALIGAILALLAYVLTGDGRWLLGGVILIVNWPWTLLVMRGINRDLSGMNPDAPTPLARSEIVRWGKFHGVRTALGTLAALVFIWAMN